MGAEQQVSLSISGDPLLITCHDTSVIASIRQLASQFEAGPTPLLGFHIAVPTPTNKMWVLLGGDGVVLARARSAAPILRSLLRSLSAMAHPQDPDTHRLRLSAVAGDSGVVLVDPYLLAAQPVAERRYELRGLRILDSPYIDVTDQLRLASASVNALTPSATDAGHSGAHDLEGSALGLLWRSTAEASTPTAGQAVHAIASRAVADTEADKLGVAVKLAGKLEIALVAPDVSGSLIAAAADYFG